MIVCLSDKNVGYILSYLIFFTIVSVQ